MAEIPVQKKTSRWWIWVVVLIALALIAWWAMGRGVNNGSDRIGTDAPAATTQPASDANTTADNAATDSSSN